MGDDISKEFLLLIREKVSRETINSVIKQLIKRLPKTNSTKFLSLFFALLKDFQLPVFAGQ